ncbi:hypothetical protein Tco_0857139 [Tanacetum coccineum]|uniref:Uncharacterized protein n=1 Tax=Tanacetum coccineum TaxID=301880 RepID=A0ABQ5B7H4_9ASTR
MGYLIQAYYSISPTRYYKDDSCWSADLKSKATEDIISIRSFKEVLVLILYILVRKIFAPKHGIGKGLMRKGDVPKPEKKDVVPKHSSLITAEDNVLFDPGDALEYAKQVSIEETQHQEKERRTKHRHAEIKQAILEEIKRKDIGEGSGAAPESLDHSSSSDDSSESATDDKTESERDLDHDESENDFKNGDESDKQDDEQVHEGQTEEILGQHNPVWFQKTTKEHPVQSWFNELVDAEEEPEEHDKPLALTGPPGKKRIPVNYFFNHDLEYLVKGSKERTYDLSIKKIKPTMYEDEGIEEMIPTQ